MFDVLTGLSELARQRAVFHSEADFQHALAWHLHEQEPNARVRLEYRPLEDAALYLDLWIESSGHAHAIELKYPTRKLEVVEHGERFSLRNHAAVDPHRYDFVKDVERLERVAGARPNSTGYAICLTNDSAYWNPTHRSDTGGHAFRMHEGARLTGTLEWSAHAGAGTVGQRNRPLRLAGTYTLRWREYSVLKTKSGQERFRVLIVTVPAGSK